MQAVVEAPPMQSSDKPVSFRIEGDNIPKPVLAFLIALFPDYVRIDDDEELVAVEDTEWYKEAEARMTRQDSQNHADQCWFDATAACRQNWYCKAELQFAGTWG